MNNMEGTRNLYVFGIGGISNGGKTTLSESLITHLKAEEIQVKVIHQDDYFKKEDEVPWHESGKFRKWDDLVALDLPKMIDDVCSLIGQMQDYEDTSVLLIEGFLIYSHKNRVYDPPDTETIFEDHVWPMYVSFYNKLKNENVALVEFDGTSSKESILDAVVGDVQSLINKSSAFDHVDSEISKIGN